MYLTRVKMKYIQIKMTFALINKKYLQEHKLFFIYNQN
jgi:hypothetical protein